MFHVMGKGRTQSSRGHNKAFHYANSSVSQDAVGPDVLQRICSLHKIIAVQAFSILNVLKAGWWVFNGVIC